MVGDDLANNSDSGRRRFLKTTGVLGVGSLAGCLSGGSGNSKGTSGSKDATSIVYTTHGSSTVVYSASQGLASGINQNTIKINLEVRPSSGGSDNAGRLDSGDADWAWIDLWSLGEIQNGVEPYSQLSFEPYQILNIYTLPWMLVSGSKDLTSTGNINGDHNLYLGPPETGTRKVLKRALSHYVDDYQLSNVGYGSQGSAFSEGRLDVGHVAKVNQAFEPGWGQKMRSVADVGFMTWPDSGKKLRNDDRLVVMENDMTDIDGYNLYEHPHRDSITAVAMSYNTITHDKYPYEPVKNFLETLYEQRDKIGDKHALLGFYENIEYWVENMHEGTKFHPAAADFYKEKGVWDSSWTVGEIQ